VPNRNLTPDELAEARALLDEIRQRLVTMSHGDPELLFAYRRKLFKELTYDERSKPSVRRRLKAIKQAEQHGLCAVCQRPLPSTYCVLDRAVASLGYTADNTRLIHQRCDAEFQASRAYA